MQSASDAIKIYFKFNWLEINSNANVQSHFLSINRVLYVKGKNWIFFVSWMCSSIFIGTLWLKIFYSILLTIYFSIQTFCEEKKID